MVYNFQKSQTSPNIKFYGMLIIIWGCVLMNLFFIYRYQTINIDANYDQQLRNHQVQNKDLNFIQNKILERFLNQFSSWVPYSLRVQKVDISPTQIRVYGRVDDEKIFSILWGNFKTQKWIHQLKLLKWEFQSASKWIFALQVNV